jgi:hypothetical protein
MIFCRLKAFLLCTTLSLGQPLKRANLDKITRQKLLSFRQRLADNREEAVNNYPEASFDLLEFDRLNQQGTNDASSIKERYRILSQHFPTVKV